MVKPREQHRRAMEFLSTAEVAMLAGEPRARDAALRSALELEVAAAEGYATRLDLEPTRAQLFKGACLIALKLREWRIAERMAAQVLAGFPPESIAEELRNILEDVHFTRHIIDEKVVISENEIDLTVAGEAVGFGIAHKDEVFRRVDVLQTIFIRNAERRRTQPFRRQGRPNREIMRDVQIYLETPRAASFGMRLKLGSDQGTFEGMTDVGGILEDTKLALRAFQDDSVEVLKEVIPDESYRTNFVSVARELLPDGKRIKAVHLGFQGEKVNQVVSLTKKRRTSTLSEPRIQSSGGLRSNILALTGELRLLDSREESEYFVLIADDGKTKKLYAPSEVMGDVLPHYYKSRVKVMVRREGQRFIYVDIDRIDYQEEEFLEADRL